MKKIALTVFGSWFLVSCCLGQEIEWQNTIGGSSVDMLTCLQPTSDGGCILGGYSGSPISGDKTENSMGMEDYWVVKLDSTGNLEWQNTIGGNHHDLIWSIIQTSDKGYLLGGYSYSGISGDKTESSQGLHDYWVIKLDSSGIIQWQNTIGGAGEDKLYSIIQVNDGGYLLGGMSLSDSSGDKSENCRGGYDIWIVKLDGSGVIQWQKTIGGSLNDAAMYLLQTFDGGYILGGASESGISGDKTENNFGASDFWIIKLDNSGIIQWQKTIGGNNYDGCGSVVQTPDGGYMIGGSSNSQISGNKTENCIGDYDYWILKLDAHGNIQWQNTIGGSDADNLTSLILCDDGGYFLAGSSASNISGDKTENSFANSLDYWILKLDGNGNIVRQNTIGGDQLDALSLAKQTSDKGFICAGYSNSNISGDKSENCWGFNDYWVVKIAGPNVITGKLFIDSNSNLVHDPGELALSNHMIKESSTSRMAFSKPDGNYFLSVPDTGNYTVIAQPVDYYSAVPVSHNIYFPVINQTDSLNDFAFQPLAGSYNDLCVTITPLGTFRAGTFRSYIVNYENAGTSVLNATIIFFPDNDVTFSSSSISPISITPDSVTWNAGVLLPFQTGSILVTVYIDIVPVGTLINSSVRIEPVAGDINPSCNYSAWEVYTVGGVDPNGILVDRDTILTTELSTPPYLNYIIYFQNTGNDTAFLVKVMNEIPEEVDLNSIEFVASSHPVNIRHLYLSRFMEFKFDNILLPDSGANEPASHGFIRYRIKPVSTLIAGDSIKNNAAIYFDFNAPVLTDTAVTKIVLPTGEEEFIVQSSKLKVYPSPVRDELIVNSYSLTGKKAEIKIYDLYGREVFQLETLNFELETKINVSRFSQGIYFVELQSGEKILRGKFLKE